MPPDILIARPRRSGKTTDLIHFAHAHDLAIVCAHECTPYVVALAAKLECPVRVFTWRDLQTGVVKRARPKGIVFDDIDHVLRLVADGVRVFGGAMTIEVDDGSPE